MIEYIGLAILGILMNVFRELADIEKNQPVQIKAWFQRNKFNLIYSLFVCIGALFIFQHLNQLTIITAIMAGYSGDTIIKTKFKAKTAK